MSIARPGVSDPGLRRGQAGTHPLRAHSRRRGDRRLGDVSVASAVVVFALSGLAALILVAAGAAWLQRRTATSEAIANARRTTELVARALIEPSLSDGILSGDPGAMQRLDTVVRQQVLRDAIVRVKVWARDGRIVYSDEPRLIGAVFPLANDDVEAFYSGSSAAAVSDLTRPENRFETPGRRLLEVYYPVHTPGGEPLLFETYLAFSSVASSGRDIWLSFLPALVAGLVALELVQLPLALWMAGRLRRGQRDREVLLRRAMEASDVERRRIASELHDSAVQQLAGQSLALAASADRFSSAAPPAAVEAFRQAAQASRKTHQQLRSLLFDIYPPNLEVTGLKPAVDDLLLPLAAQGIHTRISVPDGLTLDQRTRAVVYRASREALSNVRKHAAARTVSVSIECEERAAVLLIEDDGRGFSLEEARLQNDRGHVGLLILRDLASGAGGTIDIESAPGCGTRIRLEVPR